MDYAAVRTSAEIKEIQAFYYYYCSAIEAASAGLVCIITKKYMCAKDIKFELKFIAYTYMSIFNFYRRSLYTGFLFH